RPREAGVHAAPHRGPVRPTRRAPGGDRGDRREERAVPHRSAGSVPESPPPARAAVRAAPGAPARGLIGSVGTGTDPVKSWTQSRVEEWRSVAPSEQVDDQEEGRVVHARRRGGPPARGGDPGAVQEEEA